MSSSKKLMRRLMPLLLVLPVLSRGQASRLLPLQEALLLARQHSSQLVADSLQFRMAAERVAQVSASALPQLNVSMSYQRMSNNITPFTISLPAGSFQINPQILDQSYNAVQLTQLLYSGGKLRYSKQAAVKEEMAGKADYAKSQLALERQVTDLWFNLYNAKASQKIILANIEALSKKRADLESFRVEGLVLANDVLKIDLAITSLRSGLADITSVAGSLQYALCITTGMEPATVIEIPEDQVHTMSVIDPLQTYTDAALAGRPELQGIKWHAEAAAFHLKAVKADYLPTLNLIGNYNYDRPNQRVIPNVGRFDYSAYAGLHLNWRISSLYTNKSRVSEVKMGALQTNYALQQTRELIQTEVNTLYLEYRKTLEKMTLIQTELTQATENYRVEQNKLDAQTTTPTDFLNANTLLLQAQLNLTSARANAELAYKKLIQSTGVSAQ